jgi:hypothetical protein
MKNYKQFGVIGILYSIALIPYILLRIAVTSPGSIPSEAKLYAAISLLVAVLFMCFMFGFWKLGKQVKDNSLAYAAVAMMIFTPIYVFLDVWHLFNVDFQSNLLSGILAAVLSIWFGISLIRLNQFNGSLTQIAGTLYIVMGIASISIFFTFITFLLAIPVHVLLVILMFKIGKPTKSSV